MVKFFPELHERNENERVTRIEEEKRIVSLEYERLNRMRDDILRFVEDCKLKRRKALEEKSKQYEADYAQTFTERLEQRRKERREKRRLQWLKGKQFNLFFKTEIFTFS